MSRARDIANLQSGAIINEAGADLDFRIESDDNANMFFVDGGNDKVGIGTNSPSRNFTVSSSDQTDLAIIAGTSSSSQLCFGDSGDDNIGQIEYAHSTNHMALYTNATERMRIDSLGNVGIGGTPVTWNSGNTALQIGGNGILHGSTALGASKFVALTHNAHIDSDSSWEYISTDEASNYYQSGGAHYFRTAASGTAGNNITWTTTLTINSSGGVDASFFRANNFYTGVGSQGFVNVDTNNCKIVSQSGDVHMYFTNDGSAYMYHDGSERIKTLAGGLELTGNVMIGTATEGAAASDNFTISGSGSVGMTIRSTDSGDTNIYFSDGTSGDDEYIGYVAYNHANNFMNFGTSATERMRIDSSGHIFIVKSSSALASVGIELLNDGRIVGTASGDRVLLINRLASDGDLVDFYQAGSKEGTISVSGSTVSYNGFSGLHETSGIASNVAIGTICSTIDELDVYPDTQKDVEGETEEHPKKGETRADHAKIKVSDTEGDKRVYGVLQRYDDNGKPLVASVGIGSVKVTGACEGGDLLESNGDGTAKVQSDDIIRSKTIGKVTIGNSGTGVKLVPCVLYCG